VTASVGAHSARRCFLDKINAALLQSPAEASGKFLTSLSLAQAYTRSTAVLVDEFDSGVYESLTN